MAGTTGPEVSLTSSPPGAVFDCHLLLQALLSPDGPAFACARLVEERTIVLFLSPEVLAEARDVCSRPKLQRKFPRLTPERVESFLQKLQTKAVSLSGFPQIITLPRDPKDEKYVNLAVAAGAGYLVTRDKDFLDLRNDAAFRQHFPGLSLLDPVAFLQEIAQTEQHAQSPSPDPATGHSAPDLSAPPDHPLDH